MKKTVVAVLLVAFAAALFTGCGKRTDAVKQLEARISGIGTVTRESGELLAGIRADYEALSDKEKAGVKKKLRTQLEEKETQYASLTEITEYLAQLSAIGGNGAYTKDSRLSELLGRAEDIRGKYNALPGDVQSQIEDFDRLDTLLSGLQSFVDNAQTGAVEYVKAFNRLNNGKNYTVTAVYCSKQLDTVQNKEMHFYALTYLDGNGEEHTVYAHARTSAGVSAEAIRRNADQFFLPDPPAGGNDPVTNGNVTLDLAAILEAAK